MTIYVGKIKLKYFTAVLKITLPLLVSVRTVTNPYKDAETHHFFGEHS